MANAFGVRRPIREEANIRPRSVDVPESAQPYSADATWSCRGLEVDESERPRPDEQTRHVAAWLETCAGRRGTPVGRREPRLHRLADARRP